MILKLLVYISIVIVVKIQLAANFPFHSTNGLEKIIYEDGLIHEHGEINFLDHNGQVVEYNADKFHGINLSRSDVSDRENILFHLYTRNNPIESYQLFVDDIPLLQSSPFNRTHRTKIILHGWTDSIQGDFVQKLKNVYLEDKSAKFNVIAVDWSNFCGGIDYIRAANNTKRVGKYIAKFLDFLIEEIELNLNDLHIIGHSLGAHTAGNLGKLFTSPRKISRITGLDPALPLFTSIGKKLFRSLKKDDAEFVDVVHTDGGTMGLLDPIGHIDFYPNGGIAFQPGCNLNITSSCNHARAWIYYEESVRNKNAFPTKRCENLKQALKGDCDSLEGNSPNMGEYAYYDDKFANGLFYTKTNEKSPFSINDY